MSDDTHTLAELMLHADRLCSRVEGLLNDAAPILEEEQLRLKLGQCRNLLARLQDIFNIDELSIENASVRAEFRLLVMALLWVAFYTRGLIDFKSFRMLVMIEAGFTYLLNGRS